MTHEYSIAACVRLRSNLNLSLILNRSKWSNLCLISTTHGSNSNRTRCVFCCSRCPEKLSDLGQKGGNNTHMPLLGSGLWRCAHKHSTHQPGHQLTELLLPHTHPPSLSLCPTWMFIFGSSLSAKTSDEQEKTYWASDSTWLHIWAN